jgi:hypothetical protein
MPGELAPEWRLEYVALVQALSLLALLVQKYKY